MEIWDLYDISGNKLNQTCIRGECLPENTYHLVVHIIIKNSEGLYLIQKRSDSKELWPGQWAFTGGSATIGEDSELAALRELSEETGIILKRGQLQFLERLFYSDYLADIWYGVYDGDIGQLIFQEEEVSALDYVSEEAILNMMAKNTFHHYRQDFLDTAFKQRV